MIPGPIRIPVALVVFLAGLVLSIVASRSGLVITKWRLRNRYRNDHEVLLIECHDRDWFGFEFVRTGDFHDAEQACEERVELLISPHESAPWLFVGTTWPDGIVGRISSHHRFITTSDGAYLISDTQEGAPVPVECTPIYESEGMEWHKAVREFIRPADPVSLIQPGDVPELVRKVVSRGVDERASKPRI